MDLRQEDMKYGIMKNVVNNYKHCWIWYTIESKDLIYDRKHFHLALEQSYTCIDIKC